MSKIMIGNLFREKLPPGASRALRLARWRARRVSASLRYGSNTLQSTPVLFGNSFPKSGTHLLAQVLHAFPGIGPAVDRGMGPILTFIPESGRQRSAQEILAEIGALRAGDLCFGHVIAAPEIVDYMHRMRFAHYFILRDPRDVVISHAFFLADKAVDHVHHAYYKELASLDDRIRVSILGRPDWNTSAGASVDMSPAKLVPVGDFPDIGARFQPYLDWLDQPDVLVLRFEDFILSRQAALARLLDYAEKRGFRMQVSRELAYEILTKAIDPKSSFTFRGGRVGDWQKHFTSEHKELFKRCAGDLLVRLGYEKDENW
jgi:sulfotransferase 6B1